MERGRRSRPEPVHAAGQQWEVLVGFVQCDASGQHFTAATITGRRYAGVKADTVSASSGTLALRSQPTATPGQPASPAASATSPPASPAASASATGGG